LGYPVPGGNKYRNLALQGGGVPKIETHTSKTYNIHTILINAFYNVTGSILYTRYTKYTKYISFHTQHLPT
jgi:hypothetical protein